MCDCIVLAGGRGSRVKEFTNGKIPKILIPIDGEPFIAHLIDALLIQGVKSIVFAAGIQGDQIVDYLETSLSLPQRRYGYFQAVVEDYPRGTGGAIKCALKHSNILSKNPRVMVVNGDSIVFKPKLPMVSNLGLAENCILGYKGNNDGSFGSVGVEEESTLWMRGYRARLITSFEEKNRNTEWVNLGCYLFNKSLFDDVPEVCSLEYDLLPNWVKDELFFLVETHPGDKVDIGTTERINNLQI
jgi:D-glycero-alpha-D-manno-heptose 1-phosphate guanylyltransferase